MNPTEPSRFTSTLVTTPPNNSRLATLDLKFLTEAQKVIEISEALVTQQDCIWARHIWITGDVIKSPQGYATDLAVIHEDNTEIPLINVNVAEWSRQEKSIFIDPKLKIHNILHSTVPNLFFYWLADKSFQPFESNAHAIEPEIAITTIGQPLILSCIDFIYLTLYLAQLISKETIQKIYLEQFNFKNIKKVDQNLVTLNWYGIHLENKLGFSEAKSGDVILVYRGHSMIPEHCFLFQGNDTGIGLWKFPSVPQGCRFFAQKFSIETAMKEAHAYTKDTYTLFTYPLHLML